LKAQRKRSSANASGIPIVLQPSDRHLNGSDGSDQRDYTRRWINPTVAI
jgi:hypothetical protein